MATRRREKRAEAAASPKATDPLQTFAEKVRDHPALDSRWAVLQEARVEYFRGKDFAALMKGHPDLGDIVVPPDVSAGNEMDEFLGAAMLNRKLVVRCDRAQKTLRPGRKKLSKWPARLEVHPHQVFTEDEGFYAWTFERRRPFWQTVLSFLVPIFTVACCLFPVFPYWAKLSVLYLCMGLLCLIFGVLLVRWLIYGVIWIAVGKRIWFFPNILAEEASLTELFRFWPDMKDDEPAPKLTTRLAVAGFTALCVWLSVTHAPDEKTRARYRQRAGNVIDEVLTWSPAMLAGNTSANATPEAVVVAPPSVEKVEVNETERMHQIFQKAADLGADLGGDDAVDVEDGEEAAAGSQEPTIAYGSANVREDEL